MTTNPLPDNSVKEWLLESDPAIRWQVLQDLLDAPTDEVAAERARVASEGWGGQLLALQAEDGQWGGTAWNHGWDSTMHALLLLKDFGLDPASEQARRAVKLVHDKVIWEYWNTRFFDGEVEPCINGQTAAAGAYFGQDVQGLIKRLLGEQLADGGWNCEAERGSTRGSFNTTICVLEALLAQEQTFGATPELTEARRKGQEYLLERHLFRRKSTGEIILQDRKGSLDFTSLAFPNWWHYDILRGLDYLRQAGADPADPRLAEAVEVVASKRSEDGRWRLEISYPGRMPVDFGESMGQPSRWITLKALRVLKWYSAGK